MMGDSVARIANVLNATEKPTLGAGHAEPLPRN
jgi:hypothetical protein